MSVLQEDYNEPDRKDDENDRYDKAKLVFKSDESILSSWKSGQLTIQN